MVPAHVRIPAPPIVRRPVRRVVCSPVARPTRVVSIPIRTHRFCVLVSTASQAAKRKTTPTAMARVVAPMVEAPHPAAANVASAVPVQPLALQTHNVVTQAPRTYVLLVRVKRNRDAKAPAMKQPTVWEALVSTARATPARVTHRVAIATAPTAHMPIAVVHNTTHT